MERRVVLTGLGALTPIGNNTKEFWEGIKNGKCGIDKITYFDLTEHKVSLAAELKEFDAEIYLDKKSAKRLDKFSQYAMVAAKEAWEDSGLDKEVEDMERVGVIVGSGIGGIETIETEKEKCMKKGPDRVAPMYIPMGISNMATGNVAIQIGARGESYAMVTACASATHCIGEAYRTIKHGYQDIMVAGGTEASITPLSVAGFANIKALSRSEDKSRASMPFDKERNGFIMGEGAGIVVIEELEHAKARGAKIYAELVGYGVTSDAYHITSPAPGGEGGARAMKNAMKEANVNPEEITYINAHGTSTPLNDKCETQAIKAAFGEVSKKVMVSSTKGHTGHLLGAAGGIELIACAKAIEESFVPATINYKVADEECDLDIVPNEGRKSEVTYAMSNSLGFGGHNSTLLLKKYKN